MPLTKKERVVKRFRNIAGKAPGGERKGAFTLLRKLTCTKGGRTVAF